MHTTSRALTVTAFVALLAGCGGGGSGTAVPSASRTSANTASVAMTIVIPRGSASSARRPQYVSAGTKVLVLVVNGDTANPQTIDTTGSNPNCTITPTSTTCVATVSAPIGTAVPFDLTAYDGPPATANKLTHGSTTHDIVAGSNSVPIVMGGIVKSLAISPTSTLYEGASGTAAGANVVAKDAAGYQIVGTFDSPLSVAGTGGITVTSGTLASSSDSVTFNYHIPDPAGTNNGFSVTGFTIAPPAIVNPASISTTNLALWYDAADTAVVTAGSKIATWVDRSHPGITDVTQGSAASQPTATAGAINGQTALVFVNLNKATTGVGQYLTKATGFPTGDYSIFVAAKDTSVVFNPPNTSPYNYSAANLISGGIGVGGSGHALSYEPEASTGTSTSPPAELCLYESLACVNFPRTSSANIRPADLSGAYRVTAIVNSATHTNSISVTGKSPSSWSATVNAPRNPDPSIDINDFGGAGINSSDNTIGEIIVLNHAATSAEQTAIEAYLRAKWGV